MAKIFTSRYNRDNRLEFTAYGGCKFTAEDFLGLQADKMLRGGKFGMNRGLTDKSLFGLLLMLASRKLLRFFKSCPADFLP